MFYSLLSFVSTIFYSFNALFLIGMFIASKHEALFNAVYHQSQVDGVVKSHHNTPVAELPDNAVYSDVYDLINSKINPQVSPLEGAGDAQVTLGASSASSAPSVPNFQGPPSSPSALGAPSSLSPQDDDHVPQNDAHEALAITQQPNSVLQEISTEATKMLTSSITGNLVPLAKVESFLTNIKPLQIGHMHGEETLGLTKFQSLLYKLFGKKTPLAKVFQMGAILAIQTGIKYVLNGGFLGSLVPHPTDAVALFSIVTQTPIQTTQGLEMVLNGEVSSSFPSLIQDYAKNSNSSIAGYSAVPNSVISSHATGLSPEFADLSGSYFIPNATSNNLLGVSGEWTVNTESSHTLFDGWTSGVNSGFSLDGAIEALHGSGGNSTTSPTVTLNTTNLVSHNPLVASMSAPLGSSGQVPYNLYSPVDYTPTYGVGSNSTNGTAVVHYNNTSAEIVPVFTPQTGDASSVPSSVTGSIPIDITSNDFHSQAELASLKLSNSLGVSVNSKFGMLIQVGVTVLDYASCGLFSLTMKMFSSDSVSSISYDVPHSSLTGSSLLLAVPELINTSIPQAVDSTLSISEPSFFAQPAGIAILALVTVSVLCIGLWFSGAFN